MDPLSMFVAVVGGYGALTLFALMMSRKGQRHMFGGDIILTADYAVADFLVTHLNQAVAAKLRAYKLTQPQFANVKDLAMRIQRLNEQIGHRARINSGGRPMEVANFPALLRADAQQRHITTSAVDKSDHAVFAAADLSYPDDDPDTDAILLKAYEAARQSGDFGQVLINPDRNYLHVSLPRRTMAMARNAMHCDGNC